MITHVEGLLWQHWNLQGLSLWSPKAHCLPCNCHSINSDYCYIQGLLTLRVTHNSPTHLQPPSKLQSPFSEKLFREGEAQGALSRRANLNLSCCSRTSFPTAEFFNLAGITESPVELWKKKKNILTLDQLSHNFSELVSARTEWVPHPRILLLSLGRCPQPQSTSLNPSQSKPIPLWF